MKIKPASLPKMPAMPKVDFRAAIEDFKSLDPKDVGNWPLLPRVVVLVAIFAAVLIGGWWFDWKPQGEELDLRRDQESKLKEEFLAKKKQAVNLDEHIKQLAEIDRSFGSLLKQLPNKSEMEALLIEINQAGLGRGLQFELFKPGVEITKDFYAELPITIKLLGSYHDLGAFAGDIAKLSRIVILSEVVVDTTGKDQGLKLDAIANTYRYLDDEEVARQKREKAAKAAPKK
jgi:type IV pilus assembly protein PilO